MNNIDPELEKPDGTPVEDASAIQDADRETGMQDAPVVVSESGTGAQEQAGGVPGELGDEKDVSQAPVKESRFRRFLWRTARWTLGLLIVFALGFLTAFFSLYSPAREEINASRAQNRSLQSEVESAEAQVSDLEGRIEALTALETRNQELGLYTTILSARSDVISARLALANEDPARARAALARTGETLAKLGELLDAGQSDLVSGMQDRLDLVLSEIDEDAFAADSDLGVLERNLLELENDYFTGL